MDSRSVVFLEVMGGIAVIGLAAFVIFLIASYARQSRGIAPEGAASLQTQSWHGPLLALILVVAVALVLIWQFAPLSEQQGATADWRSDSRSVVFLVVMLVAGGLCVAAFLVFLFAQLPKPSAHATPATTASPADEGSATTPSGVRLVGLLLLGVAFLLLNWIYVAREQQFALVLYLLYPASFAVALVLLFDKATRGSSAKGAAETAREWLFCDAIVFLLVLGFVNLSQSGAGPKYAAMFWDFVFIVSFFATFWLIDRRDTRYRFLIAHGYLIVLPILMLIWRQAQGVTEPEGLSWWSTIWPFFYLAIIFFLLEVVFLIVSRADTRHVVPAVKDAIFLVIYGILLIVSVPSAGG